MEAAATLFVLGEDMSAQIQAFEALSHCEALDSDCAALREHIEGGWTGDGEESEK